MPSPGNLDALQLRQIEGARQRILQRAVGIVQRRGFNRGLGPLLRGLADEAVGMPLALAGEVRLVERAGIEVERRRQSQPREMIHDERLQTWKDLPQPQRPFSLGFLKTKPDFSFSSS